MERIKNSIKYIKDDLTNLIYHLSSLIGYIHMDFDKELPDENYWDKQRRADLYQKANKFLETINDAIYTKEYGEISKTNIINKLENIYFEATNKDKKPQDIEKPWVDDENEEEES